MSGPGAKDESLASQQASHDKEWNPDVMDTLRAGYRDMFSADRPAIPAGNTGKEYGTGIFTSDVKRTTRERLEAIEEFIELMQAHARQERAVAQNFVADLQHNLMTLREENILLEKQAVQLRSALDRSDQRISFLEESNIALGVRVSQMAEDHRERHSQLHRELDEVKDGIGFVSQHDLPVTPMTTRDPASTSPDGGSHQSDVSNGSGGFHSPPRSSPGSGLIGRRTPTTQNPSSRLSSRGGGTPLPVPNDSFVAVSNESRRIGASDKTTRGPSPQFRSGSSHPKAGSSPASVRTEMLLARYGSSAVKE